MFLVEPRPTPYDLHFRLGGIPVRIHPFFWLVCLFLGINVGRGPEAAVLLILWIGTVFISILVHELGHAIAMRAYGRRPRIVLYALGGLAIADGGQFAPMAGMQQRHGSPWPDIIIAAVGPGAGFLLAGLSALLFRLMGGTFQLDFSFRSLMPVKEIAPPEWASPYFGNLFIFLLFVNIFWGLLNLVPVYPLDGGQIARELLTWKNPWNGIVRSFQLSVIVGIGMAVLGLLVFQEFFLAFMFAALAYSNYAGLQQMGGGIRGGGQRW